MKNIYFDIGFPPVSTLLLETKRRSYPDIVVAGLSPIYVINDCHYYIYSVYFHFRLRFRFVGGENRNIRWKPPTCHKSLSTLSNKKCCIEYTSTWMGFQLIYLVAICTDCTCSCKSNYHTITTGTPLPMIKQVSGFIQILLHHPQIKPIITI
jgi:hypothetical protein